MKSNQLLSIIITLLFITSCNKKEKEFSMNEPSIPYAELQELALTKGDTVAYHEMSIAFMDSPNDVSFLNTAVVMANKHNFRGAFLDVYYFLTDYYHRKDFKNLDDMDERLRVMALEYLIKGAEKREKECQRILGRYYLDGKYVEKDTIQGNQLLKESGRY